MRSLFAGVLAFGLGCAGFAIGHCTAPRAASAPPSSDVAALRSEMAEVRGSIDDVRRLTGILVAQMASLASRAELASAASPAHDAATNVKLKPPDDEPPAHPQDDPRFREAETMIATSITRGTWSQRDVEHFRELSGGAPDVEWIKLIQRIDAAVNAGELKPAPGLVQWH